MSDHRDQHSSQDTGGSGTDSPAHPHAPRIPNIPPYAASPSASGVHLPSTNTTNESEVSVANQRRQWRHQRYGDADDRDDPDRPDSTAPIDDSEVPTPQNMADLDSVPISDEQKARIIDRHLNLPGAEGGAAGASAWSFAGSAAAGGAHTSSVAFPSHGQDSHDAGASRLTLREANPSPQHDGGEDGANSEYFAPHHAQGGAIVEDIYRWAHQNRRKAARRTRSESAHLPRTSTIDPELDVEQIREPGGFRRFFMLNQAQRQGQPPPRALRSFIDFLSLYGHFAGEDLNESDDEDDDDEDEDEEAPRPREVPTERSALLRRRSSRRRYDGTQGSAGDKPRGEASVTEAVMMLLKSFVGTGILFLGKAFLNGGLLFSSVFLCAVALISLKSFLLLVQANLKVPASFGDMGGILYGPRMRLAILTSIVFSQLGFVAAYTVFVAENLQAFVLGVTNGRTNISPVWFIVMQAAIFIPLSLVRKIAKLSSTALIADAFILAGIIYLYQYEIRHIAEKGFSDVKAFNPESFPLFVGTSVFTFEGVGLVIPITESMQEPHRFPKALSWVMIVVMFLFTSSGALSYLAFGSKTQTVVMTNLPQNYKFVQALLFLYAVAILLSTPLQLFPALQILERGVFASKSGKYNPKVKMYKNLFRISIVVVSVFFAWAGSSKLDVFVSFIGSVFCVPLCFIFPVLLSLKALNDRPWYSKAVDVAILIFGIGAMAFAGTQTIAEMFKAAK